VGEHNRQGNSEFPDGFIFSLAVIAQTVRVNRITLTIFGKHREIQETQEH
jgi:hypothetical protein